MALDSYANLQTAILSWLARPGDPLVSPAVPDIIRLFEREANRRLKVGAAEKRAQLQALSSGVALPDDFGELRLATSGGVNLTYVPPMQLPGLSGCPGSYTIVGNDMYLGPSPSGEAFIDIIYQSGVPPLSDDNPTNWLLRLHPDCYLFGSLVEAEAFIGHDERIQLWAARRQAAFESIESADRKARWNGSPLQIRADGFPGSGGSSGAGDWTGAPPVPIPITGVFAGQGLIGGGTEGSVTLALQVPVPIALGGSGATTAASAPWALRTTTDAVPPTSPQEGDLWWDEVTGNLFIFYTDPSGPPGQWVAATNFYGSAIVDSVANAALVPAVSGLLIPFYIYPNNPYTDATVQRLIGLMKQYHSVPVLVAINPSDGPGTVVDGNYSALIEVLHGAGGKVLGYVKTGFGTRLEADVNADIDLWNTLYAATPVDGIFLDEMPWDTGPSNVGTAYVDLYKRYTDYAHAIGFATTVGNPGTNQQGAWFKTRTADIIIVNEAETYPTEANMAGMYADGHADYSYTRRAGLVYNQPSLDTAALTTLRKYVQWVYVTDDNLTAGVLNPWDMLPSYLEGLFSALSPVPPSLPVAITQGGTGTVTGALALDNLSGSTGAAAGMLSRSALGAWTLSPASTPSYTVGFSFVGGVLAASQLLGLHKLPRAVTFPANFSGSTAGATANATASTVIAIDRALAASPNTFSAVGTLTFAAGGIAATFASTGGTAVSCAAGDVLRLTGPATADATLANVYCTLVGS